MLIMSYRDDALVETHSTLIWSRRPRVSVRMWFGDEIGGFHSGNLHDLNE